MRIALLAALLSVAISVVAQSPDCSSAGFSKKIILKAPAVFTGTLQDDKDNSIAMKGIVLTGLDKKEPKVSQVSITDSPGTFHFDSVPAGKYAITIDFLGLTVRKAKVHCATSDTCHIALVVTSVTPHDCYTPNYREGQPTIHN